MIMYDICNINIQINIYITDLFIYRYNIYTYYSITILLSNAASNAKEILRFS